MLIVTRLRMLHPALAQLFVGWPWNERLPSPLYCLYGCKTRTGVAVRPLHGWRTCGRTSFVFNHFLDSKEEWGEDDVNTDILRDDDSEDEEDVILPHVLLPRHWGLTAPLTGKFKLLHHPVRSLFKRYKCVAARMSLKISSGTALDALFVTECEAIVSKVRECIYTCPTLELLACHQWLSHWIVEAIVMCMSAKDCSLLWTYTFQVE